ncbi:hypothetical protein AAHC03_01486 [Spirometra sp. Aus1]
MAWYEKWKKYTRYVDIDGEATEPDESDPPPGEIDNGSLMRYLKDIIRNSKRRQQCDIRLYDSKIMEEITAKDDVTLQEACLDGSRTLIYEIKGPNPSSDSVDRDRVSYTSLSSSSYGRSGGQPRGVVGLHNLGNTCFMNSALQCISNIPELTEFFLLDKYKADLNHVSRLGSKGVIAECFADLIKRLWSSGSSGNAISPRDLKISIGQYAPQFVGYQQHDAQELMMFLLDFLHEDLNRVKQKPYIELKDADGRPDEEVAKEAWENYKKRNDSFIVDLFHGMLKSTVVCPDCNYTSITFDPFASLSLPLDFVATVAIIWPYSGESERISCHPYVPPRCSRENLLYYFNHVRQPQDGCQYVITEFNGEDVRILEPEEILNLRKEDHRFMAFELPSLKESSVEMATHTVNGSDPDPSETLYVEILKVINAYLDKEGVDQQAKLIAGEPSCIRVPQAFSARGHIVELQQKLDLDLCFELFTTKETLSAQNSWYCKKCKEHQRASKKFDLWSLPKVLVIHLKRFRSLYRFNKINEFVDFPTEGLKLYDWRHEEHVYDLVAVSNHMGGLGGGHYTAFAKNRYDNRWYNFDDSYTCQVSGTPVTASAYVLIYVRRQIPSLPFANGDNSGVLTDRTAENQDFSLMPNSHDYSNGDSNLSC